LYIGITLKRKKVSRQPNIFKARFITNQTIETYSLKTTKIDPKAGFVTYYPGLRKSKQG